MCFTQLDGNAGPKKSPKICHLGTIAQLCRAISLQLRHVTTIGKKLVKQQYLLHMSSQYGELRPTSGWDRFLSLGTLANFNRFRILVSLLQRRRSMEANQALHDVWQSPGLVHYVYIFGEFLPRNRILPGATFTLHSSIALSYFGSVTARHSSCGHQPNFAAFNRGRHLYLAGRPSRWALAHILVDIIF